MPRTTTIIFSKWPDVHCTACDTMNGHQRSCKYWTRRKPRRRRKFTIIDPDGNKTLLYYKPEKKQRSAG